MKMFLPIFLIPLAGIGLLNIIKFSENKKYAMSVVVIFLVLSPSFSGYYQFLHKPIESSFNKRYIEDSTYKTGRWMKDMINGSSISNDILFGSRIFAASETTHLLTTSGVANQIYGFTNINISMFKRYPLTKEEFWFDGYEGPDIASDTWEAVNMLWKSPNDFNITYFVENTNGNGNLIWGHRAEPSKLLYQAYDKGYLVYDGGKAKVWKLK